MAGRVHKLIALVPLSLALFLPTPAYAQASQSISITASGSVAHTQSLPSPEVSSPETPLHVRVEGQSAFGSAFLGALIGGFLGLAGTLGAQVVSGRIQRRHRGEDRRITHLDALAEAIGNLDDAYMTDSGNGAGDTDTGDALLAAQRKFERSLGRISDEYVKARATVWHSHLQSYALTRNEPDEVGSTALEVKAAERRLMVTLADAEAKR